MDELCQGMCNVHPIMPVLFWKSALKSTVALPVPALVPVPGAVLASLAVNTVPPLVSLSVPVSVTGFAALASGLAPCKPIRKHSALSVPVLVTGFSLLVPGFVPIQKA